MTDNYAVIFDMDGVLVDTYRAHYESWLAMARSQGLQLSEEDFARTFGRTSREIIAHFWGAGYSDADVAALDDRKEAAFREIITADFPAMAGVHELLQSLHDDGFRLAVGSSGPPENVAMVVDRIGQRELFAALVTATDVTRGKPDPQVFLIAAARLGVSPVRCAVVEDAPLGITAALAAGMTAVGLASTGRTRESLGEAAAVVDSLRELSPDFFRRLIDGRPG
ncbi:MAG: HAD family phosphatase [Candidatus Nealsonbacteria bacterium]|nr:HAD family phosphatase [Candidatus Nealsonbacteria bacterium]